MKIKVTRNHIKYGTKHTQDCPVALAIEETLERFGNVRVSPQFLIIGGYHITPPRSVSRFIRSFDNDKSVKPFNFMLNFN